MLIKADINYTKTPGLSDEGKTEKDFFEYLMTKFSVKPPQIDITRIQAFMPNILTLSKLYLNRCYDFGFNFNDSERLSCVEFVWNCYKALYPLHQVSRKTIYYFKWVKLIIVPDMFLRSVFFNLVYSSVPIDGEDSAENLDSTVKKRD